MAKTLQAILQDVGAWIDQDTTLPSGTELNVRVNYVNQAIDEWGDAYQWKQLRVTNYAPSWSVSGPSMALPANFKKLMSAPVDVSLNSANTYEEIRPEERFSKLKSDKYCYIIGNSASGNALIINPALTSGASLVLDYQAFPSSLATLQDISACPKPDFLTKRTITYILESRADSRFPVMKNQADMLLQTMIEEEATPSGGENNRVRDFFSSNGYRIGE